MIAVFKVMGFGEILGDRFSNVNSASLCSEPLIKEKKKWLLTSKVPLNITEILYQL